MYFGYIDVFLLKESLSWLKTTLATSKRGCFPAQFPNVFHRCRNDTLYFNCESKILYAKNLSTEFRRILYFETSTKIRQISPRCDPCWNSTRPFIKLARFLRRFSFSFALTIFLIKHIHLKYAAIFVSKCKLYVF